MFASRFLPVTPGLGSGFLLLRLLFFYSRWYLRSMLQLSGYNLLTCVLVTNQRNVHWCFGSESPAKYCVREIFNRAS